MDEALRIEDVFSRIREMSLEGYILRSHGLDTMRHTEMMVTSDSMIVQMVAEAV